LVLIWGNSERTACVIFRMLSQGGCCIYSEPVSCYSTLARQFAGDDDSSSSSYVDEKDDYIDDFVTTRAENISTKCKYRKVSYNLRDIVSQVSAVYKHSDTYTLILTVMISLSMDKTRAFAIIGPAP